MEKTNLWDERGVRMQIIIPTPAHGGGRTLEWSRVWRPPDLSDMSLFSILATVHSTCARMIVCADHTFENFLFSVYDSVSFIPAKRPIALAVSAKVPCQNTTRQRNQTPSVSGAHETCSSMKKKRETTSFLPTVKQAAKAPQIMSRIQENNYCSCRAGAWFFHCYDSYGEVVFWIFKTVRIETSLLRVTYQLTP